MENEKPWRWLVFTLKNGQDFALEVQDNINDYDDGFPKMIKGRNYICLTITDKGDKVSLKMDQDPVATEGGKMLVASETLINVRVPNRDLVKSFTKTANQHPDPAVNKVIDDFKFKNLKGGVEKST